MRQFEQHTGRRGGFTLVELLVVMTIIAILMGLVGAAVIKALGTGDELRLRNEISQLANAVSAFKQQYAVSYIPDTITLPPGADAGTAQYFASVWPRINPALLQNTAAARTYWKGGNTSVVLQGDQALVFWLGGPADASGNRIGWSSDPTDPMKLTGPRAQIFYEFPVDRLKVYPGSGRANSPSFVDVYLNAPYLYFSTSSSDNNYTTVPISFTLNGSPVSVVPYLRSGTFAASPRFVNPSGFQIISAGKDTLFGSGGAGWAGYAAGSGSATRDGADDVANFAKSKLGIADN